MKDTLKLLLEKNLSLLVDDELQLTGAERLEILQEVERLAKLLHEEQKMDLEEEKADLANDQHELNIRKQELEVRKQELDEKKFEAGQEKDELDRENEERRLLLDEKKFEAGLEKDEQARLDEIERAEKEAKRAKREKIFDVCMKIIGAIGSVATLFTGKFYDRMFDSQWLDKLLAFEKDEIFSTATTKEFVRDLISGIFRKK